MLERIDEFMPLATADFRILLANVNQKDAGREEEEEIAVATKLCVWIEKHMGLQMLLVSAGRQVLVSAGKCW